MAGCILGRPGRLTYMKDKNSLFVFAIIAIFFIAVISLFAQSQSKKSIEDLASLPPQPTSSLSNPSRISPTLPATDQTQPDPTADWKVYAIPFLKISLKVPPDWFIATDETDKNHVRILSASPVASPEAAASAFKLDVYKLTGTKHIKNIVDLRIELTNAAHNEVTQKGKMAGEKEVQIDSLGALYRELQGTSSAIQQLYLITSGGDVGILESSPHDDNQINIFKIIISTIKAI